MIHHAAAEVWKATLARRSGFWWSLVVAAAADSAARAPGTMKPAPIIKCTIPMEVSVVA